jgi:hypothetical protein
MPLSFSQICIIADRVALAHLGPEVRKWLHSLGTVHTGNVSPADARRLRLDMQASNVYTVVGYDKALRFISLRTKKVQAQPTTQRRDNLIAATRTR